MSKQILAIGNAITDITSMVDDAFLAQHELVKGSMSLIDDKMDQTLSQLSSEKITSGGSAGNTIATLAELGTPSAFIGKVGHDDFGQQFIHDISQTGVHYINQNRSSSQSAKSFILITPDAQRTMCTFLGCASDITQDDITQDAFNNVSILYLEGYLWDSPDTIAALKKAITLAKANSVKIAFTLSDSFCVSRHRQDFLSLINNDLDILFANEDEMLSLYSQDEFSFTNIAQHLAKNTNLSAIVTRSDKGCVVFENNKFFENPAQKIDHLIDTTGAGDAFAAGFLHKFNNNASLKESAEYGNMLASKIIQKIGARLSQAEINTMKKV